MPILHNASGLKFNKVNTATPTASAQQASPASGSGKRIVVTDIICSSDTRNANVLVKNGNITMFKAKIPGDISTGTPYTLVISLNTPLIASPESVVVTQVTGTNFASANMTGFIIK